MTATRAKRLLSVQPTADGGGSEKALIGLIWQLSEGGWECHVALPSAPRLAGEYAEAGATVHVISMPRVTTSGPPTRWVAYALAWPVGVARLARLVRRLGIDVVHSNSLHCWHGWAAAAVLRRPHVWHAREIVFQSRAALALERWLARHFADAVIAVSEAVASQLDPGNVTVVTDEADPRVFNPGRAGRFRRNAGIDDATPLVGSIARLDTWKGFDVLLDGWEEVRRARPDVELVIAGGSVAGKEGYAVGLQDRANSMPGVRWLGSRGDVPDVVADLDVFVQVSTQPEPFGLVLVEALATGVPIVAGAAGGPLEILAGAGAGPAAAQLVSPGEPAVPGTGTGGAGPAAGRLVTPGDPAALAGAVLTLLPRDGSSTARRRARTALRSPGGPGFPSVFDRVIRPRRRPLG